MNEIFLLFVLFSSVSFSQRLQSELSVISITNITVSASVTTSLETYEITWVAQGLSGEVFFPTFSSESVKSKQKYSVKKI